MLIASDGLPTWSHFLWITLAMVGARTFGMSMNRIVDHQIDSRNPRTKQRHLPSGQLRIYEMGTMSISALGIFIICAWKLGPLCLYLAPVAAVYLTLYSYAKRFTWASSIGLGLALGIAPMGAWIGITNSVALTPFLLSASVAFWSTSFDIIYHIQDRDYYIQRGLHSMAQTFGERTSVKVAVLMDIGAISFLFLAGWSDDLSWPYYAGCFLAALVLVYKHISLNKIGASNIGPSFLRTNAYVSIAVLIGTLSAMLS